MTSGIARNWAALMPIIRSVKSDSAGCPPASMRTPATPVVDAMVPDVAAQVRAVLGESADVVFDCVAVKSTTLAAIGMALKGGTVVIVGVPAADFELPIRIMQDQQIRVQGSATYVPQDYAKSR
jgi:threonine dehydrogenase-like Zn-dependent dehydrogenase